GGRPHQPLAGILPCGARTFLPRRVRARGAGDRLDRSDPRVLPRAEAPRTKIDPLGSLHDGRAMRSRSWMAAPLALAGCSGPTAGPAHDAGPAPARTAEVEEAPAPAERASADPAAAEPAPVEPRAGGAVHVPA